LNPGQIIPSRLPQEQNHFPRIAHFVKSILPDLPADLRRKDFSEKDCNLLPDFQ